MTNAIIFKIWLALLTIFATPVHGYVTEQTYEGCYENQNDYYIVNLDGELHEVEADDLRVGDEVTVYFFLDEPVRTLYGWR
jgi:intein/homing endonuclease